MTIPVKDEAPTADSAQLDAADAAPFLAAAVWGPWLGLPWTAWNEGLRLWQTWCRALQPDGNGMTEQSADAAEPGERRLTTIAPWLPRVSATVIPLHRNGDATGARAARLSMRVRCTNKPAGLSTMT
jgi:hypothetical protein